MLLAEALLVLVFLVVYNATDTMVAKTMVTAGFCLIAILAFS